MATLGVQPSGVSLGNRISEWCEGQCHDRQ